MWEKTWYVCSSGNVAMHPEEHFTKHNTKKKCMY